MYSAGFILINLVYFCLVKPKYVFIKVVLKVFKKFISNKKDLSKIVLDAFKNYLLIMHSFVQPFFTLNHIL